MQRWWRFCFWWAVCGLSRAVFGLACRRVTLGRFRLPEGGVLVVCNHISHFDPPFVGSRFQRKVDFMAMRELSGSAAGRFFFGSLDVIPVDRSGRDARAAREAVSRLRRGAAVFLFPEAGIRSGGGSVLGGAAMPRGAGWIAAMAGVPVMPCLVLGTDQLYVRANWTRRPLLMMACGELIPTNGNMDALKESITAAWHELARQMRGHSNYRETLEPATAQERWERGW